MESKMDRLLKEFDEATVNNWDDKNHYADRALYHALLRWEDSIPPLEQLKEQDTNFHKIFRQTDVTESGHTDMIIWCLLEQSQVFWQIYEKVMEEKDVFWNED